MSALDSLSEHCGILDAFVDARGETQTTTPQARRAVLAAMGLDVVTEVDAQHALKSLRAEAAERSLPPVLVHYQAKPSLELALTGPRAADEPVWRIELENGEVIRGPVPGSGNGHTPGFLSITCELPLGYHDLILEGNASRCRLIVTPGECWLPEGIGSGRRLWGVATQLYLLRSQRNWGIGDYSDLKSLVEMLKEHGADVIGLNPLHAMFPDAPEHASPYSPASRLLLNVLNIDVAKVAEGLDCPAARTTMSSSHFRETLARCRAAALVDYAGVAALKLPLLNELYWCCDRRGPQWQAFTAFRANAGAAFERTFLFLALRFHFANQAPGMGDWHRWPDEYQSPDSAASIAFGQVHAEAVTFQAWVQFTADEQLRECADAAAGMAIGLYRDLAVGAATDGAETWANPKAVVDGVHVGAPADIYNPQGQDWGLPPFNPLELYAEGYRSFIDLLRSNMRHAGALRIDHVMALQQLYWVPEGRSPAEGAYVRYPLEDLVGILALESHRHQCMVVGEDLGTVPEGFRERMERAHILSYRVLFFEKADETFNAPEDYPLLSLAVAGSHDLPTLRAWWQGKDLTLKQALALYPAPALASQAMKEREADRAALAALLCERGFMRTDSTESESFVEAAHKLLGSTSAAVTMLQLDDLTGEIDPVNVPTTSHEHPNWRRRFSVSVEQLHEDKRFLVAVEALQSERGIAKTRVDRELSVVTNEKRVPSAV